MLYYEFTSKSVEIIGKCLEQCLCTQQYPFVAELFEYISPLDRNFCMSPCIDKKIVEELAEFRKKVVAIATEDDGMDRVYRLNLQLFPLTKNIQEMQNA